MTIAEAFQTLPRAHSDPALAALGAYLVQHHYHFITPTPLTHQRNLDRLSGVARDLRGAFGWNRPFTSDLLPPELLKALVDEGAVTETAPGTYHSQWRCSSLGGNRLFHSGYPTDAPDAVFFGPDTYRFARAIEAHLSSGTQTPRRAVDIGCGSGAGALVVAKACPNTQVWGTDINPKALRITALNAAQAGATNLQAVESNVLHGVEGDFDLITANPPYMQDPKGRAYRDGGSGLGSALSLRILAEAVPRLSSGGTLLLYTGVAIVEGEDPFLAGASDVLQSLNGTWRYEELDPDVFGEDLELEGYATAERIAVVLLTVNAA